MINYTKSHLASHLERRFFTQVLLRFGPLLGELQSLLDHFSFELKQFCADTAFPDHAFVYQDRGSLSFQDGDGRKSQISLV